MPSPRSLDRHQRRELLALDLQPFGDAHVQSAGDRGDDAANRKRRMPHDACCQFARGRQQHLVRHDHVDQADLQRPRRRERVSGQQQFQRALAPDEAGSRWVPPKVGGMPRLISGLAKRACSLAMADARPR